MTVTYTSDVATITGVGIFWKLLLRWRGSIFKLIWKDLIIYSILYYSLRCVYLYALNEEQQKLFSLVSKYCRSYSSLIPLAFVLGFYVNLVMSRWWEQYMMLPWPDSLAVYVTTLVTGLDERGRRMRRTIMRYVNLTFAITMSMMSPRVKKRFPTLDHLVEAGFLMPNEKKIFDNLTASFNLSLYWMPLVWAGSIVTRARKEGRVRDDFAAKTLLDGINSFRGGCGGLLGYDWMSIPLVYTQVVTLAVYMYFASTLMGAQYVTHIDNPDTDLYVPWFTLLQYFFYVGWLKVAETLVNPFGEDDDDFELNWLIDRNIQVSYLIVDEMHNEHPELIQDKYWDEVMPTELPYTVATECYRKPPPMGSTANLLIPKYEQMFVRHELFPDDSGDDESDAGIITNIRPSKLDTSMDPEMGPHEATKVSFKEDIPDLWVSPSVPRNDSVASFLPQMLQRQKQGSLRSIPSSSSISKRAFGTRGQLSKLSTKKKADENSSSSPNSDSQLFRRNSSESNPERTPSLHMERLETMKEEDGPEGSNLLDESDDTILNSLLAPPKNEAPPLVVAEKEVAEVIKLNIDATVNNSKRP